MCIRKGTANNAALETSTSYSVNYLVQTNKYVYRSIVLVTSEGTTPST
jgi:hypothetical protein